MKHTGLQYKKLFSSNEKYRFVRQKTFFVKGNTPVCPTKKFFRQMKHTDLSDKNNFSSNETYRFVRQKTFFVK